MRKQALPRLFDARKMCLSEAVVSASEKVAALPRFAAGLASDNGEVSIDLRFFLDESHRRRMTGQASANVALKCHRCHGEIASVVAADFDYVLIFGDTKPEVKAGIEQNLPPEIDVVELEGEHIEALVLVEDELIIATPYASYHDDTECAKQTGLDYTAPEVAPVAATDETHRPFAGLADLLKDS